MLLPQQEHKTRCKLTGPAVYLLTSVSTRSSEYLVPLAAYSGRWLIEALRQRSSLGYTGSGPVVVSFYCCWLEESKCFLTIFVVSKITKTDVLISLCSWQRYLHDIKVKLFPSKIESRKHYYNELTEIHIIKCTYMNTQNYDSTAFSIVSPFNWRFRCLKMFLFILIYQDMVHMIKI